MPRKQIRRSWEEWLVLRLSAGIREEDSLRISTEESLSERLEQVRKIFSQYQQRKAEEMLFLISYDIEDNRVRRNISKYLLRKGCTRLQKSVYLGRAKRDKYKEIQATLRKVQDSYQNHDSIFFLPVGEDHLHKMQVIGRATDIELLIEPGSTFFF